MQLVKHLKELGHRFTPFLLEKQSQTTSHRCCIMLSPKEITLIHLNRLQDSIEILFLEKLQYDDLYSLSLVLAGTVNKYQLNTMPTYWLLTPADYQLFLIESLPVEPEEFNDALRWRIRSLITYPLEDAMLDYFKLPNKKGTTTVSPMIAAVVARFMELSKTIQAMNKGGLRLTTIDIPELAMRNLTNFYENDEKSTAFIYFYKDIAILNITHQKTLYFTRHINLFLDDQKTYKNYEELSLDILRYFDYFQSQWRFPSPNRVFFASEKKEVANIAKSLSEFLGLAVEAFSLNFIAVDKTKLSLLQEKYLLPIGCALREDISNAASGN